VVVYPQVVHENIKLLFFVNFSKILYFILDVPRLPSKLKNAVSWLTPPRTRTSRLTSASHRTRHLLQGKKGTWRFRSSPKGNLAIYFPLRSLEAGAEAKLSVQL
jgi:hypothetical protein